MSQDCGVCCCFLFFPRKYVNSSQYIFCLISLMKYYFRIGKNSPLLTMYLLPRHLYQRSRIDLELCPVDGYLNSFHWLQTFISSFLVEGIFGTCWRWYLPPLWVEIYYVSFRYFHIQTDVSQSTVHLSDFISFSGKLVIQIHMHLQSILVCYLLI